MLGLEDIIRTACREHEDTEGLDVSQFIGKVRDQLENEGQGDDLAHDLDKMTLQKSSLPQSVHRKYPLPDKKGKYTGALIKPASTHEFLGILSSSPLPSNDPENAEVVPSLHVLKEIESTLTPTVLIVDDRENLVEYLATAFDPPDKIAAEYLLLFLLSSPTSRPTSMTPLGTLSINFRRRTEDATKRFHSIVSSVTPHYVPLPLSIGLLHGHRFSPCSTDSSSLDAGLLQLAEGTVLVVEEDSMGNGGQLNEKALQNLKALAECMTEQRVRYEYPYMDGLKMDCATRVAVLSQGKSLLPVVGSQAHAAKLVIPDETADIIQDAFVQGRKEDAEGAEDTLKRRMKVGRLMALSYPEAILTREIWDRTVHLDEKVKQRS
ncbi:uncharacterized protein IL334_007092 [Kwoniella shivajii]|uniref:Uncharacterized protein n=1 Tax=Kwoniella shivajii TaxID=564305 RepID=A0ABZ1D877_9TREE|nr:hypothetical protein IL334_007092 [Kwoniella shivajii]